MKYKKYGTKAVRETYKQRIIRAAVVVGIILLVFGLLNIFLPEDAMFGLDIYHNRNRVTAEEYSKLYKGMTYTQIRKALGRGKLYNTYGTRSVGFDVYKWPGEYIDKDLLDAYVTVYIEHEDKKTYRIRECNVIHGKEIYQNLTGRKKAMTERSQEEIKEAIQEGITYAQAAEFLGIDGLLIDSRSYLDGDISETYQWYFYDKYYEKSRLEITFDNNRAGYIYY